MDPKCAQPVDFAGPDTADHLIQRLEQHGFVLAEFALPGPPDEHLAILAAALGLRDPYVPVLYRHAAAKNYSGSYNDIKTNQDDDHPGFSTTAGQDWHVDGLLDKIGKIKTTILYCVRDALRGGETLLFNSVAAFVELREADPAAAEALMSPDALKRTSTLPAVDLSYTGPAFAVDSSGGYITRYTDNDTCTWNFTAGAEGELGRALNFLRAASEDPRYQRAVRLGPGQALIFRNDRLSHGRRSYEDTPEASRHLIRALYAEAPTSTA